MKNDSDVGPPAPELTAKHDPITAGGPMTDAVPAREGRGTGNGEAAIADGSGWEEVDLNLVAEEPSSSKSVMNAYIWKLSLAAGLGGLLFGYDTGMHSCISPLV